MQHRRFARLLLVQILPFLRTCHGYITPPRPPHALKHKKNSMSKKKGNAIKAMKSRLHQFVFAYGSLINPESRAITNPNLANQDGLPVVVRDVERVWSARTMSGYTAMGVRFSENVECNGVLLKVSETELADLDRREKNYVRLPVQLDNVELFDEDEEDLEHADVILGAKEGAKRVKVWVYVQKDPIPADPSHPIPQSYVDIILKGCLTISEDFARNFIETTKGWHNPKEEGANFVDDRDLPIYIRADPELSASEHADVVDELLEEHTPIALEERVEYDPLEHLVALTEALEDDMAHPRALQKAEARVERIRKDSADLPEKIVALGLTDEKKHF